MSRGLKIFLISFGAIAAFGAVIGLIFGLDKILGGSFSWNNKVHHRTMVYNEETYQYNNCVNILFMGVDKFGEVEEGISYNNAEQADFLCILTINRDTKTFSLVQINRDTMVDVVKLGVNGKSYGTSYEQIALSHNEGSGGEDSSKNVVNTVSNFLEGVTIDYYVTMKMDAVEILVDYIGGVDVTLDEDQDMTPIHEEWTAGSTIHLSGSEALEFIRARGEVEDGTNLKRMRRQREFIKQFINKMKENNNFDTDYLVDGYKEAKDYLITDMGLYAIEDMIDYIRDYTFEGTHLIEGTATVNSETNYVEYYVSSSDLKKYIIEYFYEKADE